MEPRQRPGPPFFAWATDALGFIRFAYEPIKRLQTVLRLVITGLGLTIPVVLGWFGGVAWFLAALFFVVAILFLIGGVRLMHSDVDLADVEVHGSEMRLDVLNPGVRTGSFAAKVVEVTPRLHPHPTQWLIIWELEPDARQVDIPGRGRRTLLLGVAELSRRADGMLAGSVAFASPGRADIPRNFEMSDDKYQTEEPTRIKIQVDRLDRVGHVERCYEITLPYEDARDGFAHPTVKEIGDFSRSDRSSFSGGAARVANAS